ncbi:MAPEG family protein [Pseudoalteromonas sp. DL2-H2.2]|uniref:MAPEG family protein n=1 Tax=Pseudoalteromonas sp. DL2-H2.2 TaxID=2908889 RepID=UPI001F21813F|nr:MAPEG family protein [Pseudoalteromonas sp. DL2-H2.2]MCF2909389.1 MAPEG family protein [Pseudoalteromonas sp. DL2-H2.2]
MITGFFAAIFTLFYIKLSFDIIGLRHKHQVALGDGGHPALERAIRAHANFMEYTPLLLILLFALEFQGGEAIWLYLTGGTYLVGRILHSFALNMANLKLRVMGMALSFLSLLALSIINLYCYFV